MSTPQKHSQAHIFIDFIPAELHENKTWIITYYIKNPFTNQLIRKRHRVKSMKSIIQRRKFAQRMVKNINNKLENGWNPYKTVENSAVFKILTVEMENFINRKILEYKKNNLRYDTIRSYTSYINIINLYLENNKLTEITIFDFNIHQINEFLDFVYFDKGNSVRTRNNYLSFIITLFEYFVSKRIIFTNYAKKVKVLKYQKKEKKIIPIKYRKLIIEHLKKKNTNYLTLCLACYYCMIRRTELTKIRVENVVLKQGIIYIKNEHSKTKKTQPVTIPNTFIPYLVNHLKDAKVTDYLFSAYNFAPGPQQLAPKKITDQWSKLRKEIGLPKQMVWYHLKDTGITNLLLQGIPAIKVRDQARHYSIQQTEEYTPKEIIRADIDIQLADTF